MTDLRTVLLDARAMLADVAQENTALRGALEPFAELTAERVEWVVNDNAELGVKIGSQFFWLYKGNSLVYSDGMHDDGSPIMWRPVGKREFGECCHPSKFYKPGAMLPERYKDDLDYHPGLSFGKEEDSCWRPLVAPPSAALAQPGTQDGCTMLARIDAALAAEAWDRGENAS